MPTPRERGSRTAAVPEELQAKREKRQARVEKKEADADKPRKVNKSALAKKIKAQLDGIDVLERLTQRPRPPGHRQHERQDGPRNGGAGQAARQRLSARRPGGAAQLHPALLPATTASSPSKRPSANDLQRGPRPTRPAARPGQARAAAICKDGWRTRTWSPRPISSIAAWLGHAWQLRELKDAGLVEERRRTGAAGLQLPRRHGPPGIRRHRRLDDAGQRPAFA